MGQRASCVLVPVLLFAVVVTADPPKFAAHYHRDGFAGREPAWALGDTNLKAEEKDHRIVQNSYFNAPSSEYIKIDAQPATGQGDSEFLHYTYDTPACPLNPSSGSAAASVWVKSFRPGVQLRARVVLPKERNPQVPESPLTVTILGDSYPEERTRSWHRLTLGNPNDALRKQLPVLRAKLGREIDPTDAYIDRLILNVYAGPGINEVWVDDLDLGPCVVDPRKPMGRLTSRSRDLPGAPASAPGKSPTVAHPYSVEFTAGKILINKRPFFMRAVRYAGQPLKSLRDFNFNTVAFPAGSDPNLVDEAVEKNSFMVIASVPLLDSVDPSDRNAISLDRRGNHVADLFSRFRQGDGVLFWDLGSGRTTEQLRTVARTADAIREYDPKRPRSVDLWDGYSAYSEYLDVIGSHRWPLFTSLELSQYRDWLMQRRLLTTPGKLMWTWVQTHTPEWYLNLATGRPNPETIDVPLGPQPEQIRLLTYISLASGYRGLGYWTDKYLSPEPPVARGAAPAGGAARAGAALQSLGRDRLIEMYLLNTELELLEPVLFAAEDEKSYWIDTSHPYVKAAVIRGKKGIVVLPVWLGSGSQYCPDQGALNSLSFVLDARQEGYEPWLLTAATYENLRTTGGIRELPGGWEVTIPKFDLTAAVVFTNDLAPDGLVVRWQDNIRNGSAKRAAMLAKEQAAETFEKVTQVHQELVQLAPPVPGADELLVQARRSLRQAEKAFDNGQADVAYRESRTAMRPLRILMREHWQNATRGLTSPTASPYAVSFYTLPQHWELQAAMRNAQPQANVLRHGGFELSQAAPEKGAKVESLPGWSVRETHLDAVYPQAAIVNLTEKLQTRNDQKPRREPLNLGQHCLQLRVDPEPNRDPKKRKSDAAPPVALERVSLAVDSPLVQHTPGEWVRISFWARVGAALGSADGALVMDSAGGEPLAVRLGNGGLDWTQHHIYRRVPADGKIGVTFALTGVGMAWFDGVKIEPIQGLR
jgi:hypothetical protein